MVLLTQDRLLKLPKQELRARFLPAESPMQMSTQQLRLFQQSVHDTGTPVHMQLRRALIFVTTILLTVAGCYEIDLPPNSHPAAVRVSGFCEALPKTRPPDAGIFRG
jgi:hypothetical protein